MPRKSKEQQEAWAAEVKGRIEYYRSIRNTSHTRIAQSADICSATYYARLKDPSKFTLSEIGRIASYLNVNSKVLLYGIEPQELKKEIRRYEAI